MKRREIQKLLGLVAVATATTVTACGEQTVQKTETVVEVKADETVEEPTPTPTPIETKITVSYEQSDTKADELTMVNNEAVDYTVKEYIAPIFHVYLQDLDYKYRYDENADSIYLDDALVSDNIDHKEDGTLWVRDMLIADAVPVVKYVRTETEIKPICIQLVPRDSGLISGIIFVLTRDEDNEYIITDMLGVFEEDIKSLPIYEGEYIGYSKILDGEVEVKEGDNISVSEDLILYPCFERSEASQIAAEDGTFLENKVEEIEIDGVKHTVLRVIRVNGTKKDKDGNLVATKKYALAGLDAKKDKVKGVDKDKVEKQQTEEKDPAAKTEPKKPANGSDTKPGNPAPAKDPASSQAQDTFDRSNDQGGDGLGDTGQSMAARDGVEYVDVSDWDSYCYSDLSFE